MLKATLSRKILYYVLKTQQNGTCGFSEYVFHMAIYVAHLHVRKNGISIYETYSKT